MNTQFHDFASNLYLGEPQSVDGLLVIPVFAHATADMPLIDLDEALGSGAFEITELSEGGVVGNLRALNRGNSDVLLLEGEQLIGAKQNRVLNTTLVVAAESVSVLPVTCVERGRWGYGTMGDTQRVPVPPTCVGYGWGESTPRTDTQWVPVRPTCVPQRDLEQGNEVGQHGRLGYRSRNFSTAPSYMYPSLRARVNSQVGANLKAWGVAACEQGAIWDELSAKASRVRAGSETGAMSDMHEAYAGSAASIEEKVHYVPGQTGYIGLIRGGFACADVFGAPRLCERKFTKLMRSFNLDLVDRYAAFPRLDPDQILAGLRAASGECFDTPGKGQDFRFSAGGIRGSAKILEYGIPHVSVLPLN